jgi:hypothetical protein
MSAIYFPQDLDVMNKGWEQVIKEVEKEKLLILEPKYEERKAVHQMILDFIKQNKRKIYGGYALNKLIGEKNKSDMIYEEDKIPDIDFYSTDPITDTIKICNKLFEAGYKNIIGREAVHHQTYSIFVNHINYCDISYVPRNIYSKMPFKEIDGYMLIHPNFMTIDYLRIFCDPIVSYWRMDGLKAFKRFLLLQKYYPLPHNEKSIDFEKPDYMISNGLNTIFNFLSDRQTTIVIGLYAYNYFLSQSNILSNPKKHKNKFKHTEIPYYEIISIDYRNDCLELLAALKKNSDLDQNMINYKEYYPFFEYTGHNMQIYYGERVICKIYNNNNKCIPYLKLPLIKFEQKPTKLSKNIIIGSFSIILLYSLITIMRSRCIDDKQSVDLYYTIISHMIEIRNYYLQYYKKSILDNTIFRDFSTKCIGETTTPEEQRKRLIDSRKKHNKIYSFRYEPSEGIRQEESNYYFSNSSGNQINNPKNLKLSDIVDNDSDEDDGEKETDTTN